MYFISNDIVDNGGNFIMLCGAPGSGKTTYAKKFIEENPDWTRIAPDDTRRLVTGDPMNMSRDHEVFGIIFDSIRDEIEHGANVIYDATNCDGRYRKNMIKFIRDIPESGEIICLVSRATIRECFDHNDTRDDNQQVPDDVIERMYLNLKQHMPSLVDGFDVIGYF